MLEFVFNKVAGLPESHTYLNKPAAFSCFEKYLRMAASKPNIIEYSSSLP